MIARAKAAGRRGRRLKAWGRLGRRHLAKLRCEAGSALIEMAFVFTLIVLPLLLGSAEMSRLVYCSIEISSAARAGASYGMQSATLAADTTGMTSAAQDEAPDFAANLTVAPTAYYACATAILGTQYTGNNALANANSACTGTGNRAVPFVQVTTSASISPIIRCPGLPTTYTVKGFSVMEVEE